MNHLKKFLQLEEAVIITFQKGDMTLGELESIATHLHLPPHLGEYDGFEVFSATNNCKLYFYGKSATALYNHLEILLRPLGFLNNAIVTLRFGGPGAKEKVFDPQLNL